MFKLNNDTRLCRENLITLEYLYFCDWTMVYLKFKNVLLLTMQMAD